jgi:hypothetical protein
MRNDGSDLTLRAERPLPESAPPAPLDAAESPWDPLLWALYLRELARENPPTVN